MSQLLLGIVILESRPSFLKSPKKTESLFQREAFTYK